MANKKKPKKKLPEPAWRPRDFLDSIAPAAAKFNTDHFISKLRGVRYWASEFVAYIASLH